MPPVTPKVWVISDKQIADFQGHKLLAKYLAETPGIQHVGFKGALRQRLIGKFWREATRLSPIGVGAAYEMAAAQVLARTASPRRTLVHVTWGDGHLTNALCPPGMVFTLHQPYELWTERDWRYIQKSRGVLTMAEREAEAIRRRAPGVPTRFIPHGIDINFWKPAPEKVLTTPKHIAVVGRYMRNFDMLIRVAERLLKTRPDVKFRWLVNPDFELAPEIAARLPRAGFDLVRNLSPEDLRDFYQSSWLFFTPYNNVTASNAIVEAMACGTPVFSTRVGGMPSYAGADAMTLVENNDDAAALSSLNACLDSTELRASLSKRARDHAVSEFAWPRVVEAHRQFYAELVN